MERFANQIFVAFAVAILILLTLGVYFFTTSPNQLEATGAYKTPASSMQTANERTTEQSADLATASGFTLSTAQIDALVSLGVDPAAVPSSITAAQETCFVDMLGQERVLEIKAGAVPSNTELMRAESCI